MIKKIFPILSVAALAAVMTGCSEEQTLPVGEGKVYLSTCVNSDVKVESRAAAEDELAASTILWISNSEGVVRKYNGMSEVPSQGIKLIAGAYNVKAWAGTAAYASFTDRWFEGQEDFTVQNGSTTSVEVVCKIANIVASVKYDEDIDEVISDYSLTVSHKGGSLTFEGADERKGYYLMPDGVTNLDYVFTATTEGHQIERRGTIENVQPAHEYVLNIFADKTATDPTGAGFITIEVDETMAEVADEIIITTPPTVTGFGFDLSAPVAGESGSIGRKSVYVCAASEIKSIAVSGLEGIEDFDFMRADAAVLAQIAAKGVFHEETPLAAGETGQMIKIIFEDTYLNALPNRDEPYVVTIKATDSSNKSTTGALTLKVSEAPVVTAPAKTEDIDFNAITLQGQVSKEGVDAVGFEYRTVENASRAEEEWTYIAGNAPVMTKGAAYTATINGLPYDTSVEYRAVTVTAGEVDFRGDVVTTSLKPTPQLPNASIEDWSVYKSKIDVPTASYGAPWTWDCGNHGSSTMNINVTTKNTDKSMIHSGKASAKLRSQFVGVGIIGKFAAGNLVYGHYLETVGTNGIFGFGNPFDFQGLKPTALRLWMHYTPGTVEKNPGSGATLKKGDTDLAHIFVALFDGPDNSDAAGDYKGQVGFVVNTGTPRLFDKNASNIVAYGEQILTQATPGSSLVELTIPLDYYASKQQAVPTHIAIVCTASKEGDYFTGGEGSTLYVDDFTLVY